MQVFLYSLFLLAYLTTCLLGTTTGVGAAGSEEMNMLFHWPGFLLLGAVGLLSVFRWRIRIPHAPCDLCLLAGFLLVAYLGWRALGSPVYKARMDFSLAIASFITFALMASMFSRPAYRQVWVWLTGGLLLANFLVVTIHITGNYSYLPLPGFDRGISATRAGGFFVDPNHLGTAMNLFLFPLLGLAILGRGGVLKRAGLLLLVALAVVGIGASASRGSFLALLGGIGVFVVIVLLLTRVLHRHVFGRVFALVAVATGGLVALLHFLSSRFLEARFSEDSIGALGAFEHRKFYWWAGFEQWTTSLLLGTGARTYDSFWREFRPPGTRAHLGDARFAHNEYIQMLGDYGIIGLGLLLLLVILCLVHGGSFLRWFSTARYPRLNEPRSDHLGLTVGAFCGIIAVAIGSIFEFPLHVPALAVPTAALLGILANPGFERLSYNPIRMPLARWPVKLGVIASGALLLHWGIRYLPAEHYFKESLLARGEDDFDLERIGFLNKAKEIDPYNPLLFYHCGSARLKMRRARMPPPVITSIAEKARTDLEHAVALYPRDIFPRMMLVTCLGELGEVERATELSRETVRLAPFNRNVLKAHADHCLRADLLDEAERYYIANHYVGATEGGDQTQGEMQLLRDRRAALLKEAELPAETEPPRVEEVPPPTPAPVPPDPSPPEVEEKKDLVPATPPEPDDPGPLVPATPPTAE